MSDPESMSMDIDQRLLAEDTGAKLAEAMGERTIRAARDQRDQRMRILTVN